MNTLTIIIPAYNESKRIVITLKEYIEYIQHNTTIQGKLHIVINGSSDDTEAIIHQYSLMYPDIITYSVIPQKIGKGGAVIHGFRHANTDLVGFVDADNSVTPHWFHILVTPLVSNQNLDATISSRALPDSVLKNRTRGRIFISEVFNTMVNLLFFLGIKDTQCGAKIIKRSMLQKILPTLSLANMAFDVDVLYAIKQNKGNIAEIPIHWYDVDGLTTKNPMKIATAMGLGILELRLIHSPLGFLRPLLYPFYRIFLSQEQYNNRLLQKNYIEKNSL